VAHFSALWKVDIELGAYDGDSLEGLSFDADGERAHKLKEWKPISDYWTKQPPSDRLSIFVKLPATATISPSSSNDSDVTTGGLPQILLSNDIDTSPFLFSFTVLALQYFISFPLSLTCDSPLLPVSWCVTLSHSNVSLVTFHELCNSFAPLVTSGVSVGRIEWRSLLRNRSFDS
jgi:hypothetical protein